MNIEHLFKAAEKRGFQVSRVRVRDQHGEHERFLFFIRDQNGKLLFDGNSLDSAEVRRLFPDCEKPATLTLYPLEYSNVEIL